LPKVIIWDLMLILFLFVAVPSIMIYFLGLPNGLISTLIYMQLLIVWIQVELSMRQQVLFRSQFIPILTLSASSTEVTVVGEDSRAARTVTITVRNLSDNPAFNVMLSRVLSDSYVPLEPRIWTSILRCNIVDHLGSKEEKPLCITTFAKLVQLLKVAKLFEVSCFDKYGDSHFMTFMINVDEKAGDVAFMPIPYLDRLEKVGVLLPSFNRIMLYFKLFRVAKKLKKLKAEKKVVAVE